jgi:hypothetical protein
MAGADADFLIFAFASIVATVIGMLIYIKSQ